MSLHKILYKQLFKHPLVKVYLNDVQVSEKCVGWGYKSSGLAAIKNAAVSEEKLYLFEDAPVRSMKPGYGGAIFGITVDHRGAMFDARGNSDLLERLALEKIPVESATELLMKRFREHGISKYNWNKVGQCAKFDKGVLLVDQTLGDAAHRASRLSDHSFTMLFDQALAENRDSPIYIKTHPDRVHRNRLSCFTEEQLAHSRVTILPPELSPSDCFTFCRKVYVGSSLLGMEALIHGCEVITYGWNFYAGWGLTEDRGDENLVSREREHSLLELFQAYYVDYSHYYHPDTLDPCGLNEIIDHIILQRKEWQKLAGSWNISNLNPYQASVAQRYLCSPFSDIGEDNPDKLLMWGAKEVPEEMLDCTLIRSEDGFIRSRGLGANFNFPVSWVFDDLGIYFDARQQSRLEEILQNSTIETGSLDEARKLITFLRNHKVTKYNIGLEEVKLPNNVQSRRMILIPGQVDSDASIKFGSPKIKDNRELVAEVRRQHPDAYICYKPHPDLLSGARKDAPLWDGIENDVDYLIRSGDVISWIQAVDEVHTLTSTVGFEALIHGKKVFTYGLPFYACWGLTEDWLKCDRRNKIRSLEELVYAVLIEYPTYLNPSTGEYTTAMGAAKLLINEDFEYSSRSIALKVLSELKASYNKLFKQR